MKRKTKVLLISYGAALLLVFNAALWACHVGANDYRNRLDVHANRAFSEAFHAVERLDHSLKKLPFASGSAMENVICSEISSDAQCVEAALAILPVELDALEQISKHVSVVGDYAFALSRAAADGKVIPEEAKTVLADLSKTTASLLESLGALQQALSDGAVVTERYDRLTDALDDLEQGTASAADTLDTELHNLAEHFKAVPALTYDGKYTDRDVEHPLALEGKPEVAEEQARENAASFLKCNADRLESLGQSEGSIPCWRFQLEQNGETTVSVTVQGGQVLRILASEQGSASDDVDQAVKFLENHGFENMKPISGNKQQYVHVIEEVYFYPDAISVLLSDDGSVLLFDASEYLMHHQVRDLSAFQKELDVSSLVPEGVSIQESRKVIMLSPGGEERPCLELTCQSSDGTRCVMDVNLETGLQERLRLDGESNF